MNRRDGRSPKRREFSPELLEDRSLLSTFPATLPAGHAGMVEAAAARSRVLVITGRVSGTASPIAAPDASGVNTQFNGTGTARGIAGTLQVAGRQKSDLVGRRIVVSNGSVLFTSADGSSIFVTYAGSGNVARGNAQTINITGVVAGSSGAVAGASGRFTGTVTINATTAGFVLNFNLRLNVPRA